MIVFKKVHIFALFGLLVASFAGLHPASGWPSAYELGDRIFKHPAVPYIAAPLMADLGKEYASDLLKVGSGSSLAKLFTVPAAGIAYVSPSIMPAAALFCQRIDDNLTKPRSRLPYYGTALASALVAALPYAYYAFTKNSDTPYTHFAKQALSAAIISGIPTLIAAGIFAKIEKDIDDDTIATNKELLNPNGGDVLSQAVSAMLAENRPRIQQERRQRKESEDLIAGLEARVNLRQSKEKLNSLQGRLAELQLSSKEQNRVEELDNIASHMPRGQWKQHPNYNEWKNISDKQYKAYDIKQGLLELKKNIQELEEQVRLHEEIRAKRAAQEAREEKRKAEQEAQEPKSSKVITPS